VQFLSTLYQLRGLETHWLFDALSRIAIVWLIWLWLREDSRRLGITWMLDLGMFLFIAWVVLLPYHLFKTRGLKAFIPILAFILTILCGIVAAAVVSIFI